MEEMINFIRAYHIDIDSILYGGRDAFLQKQPFSAFQVPFTVQTCEKNINPRSVGYFADY